MPLAHTKDLDTLAAWAEELGWELIETNPPILVKAGRRLQLKFNGAGKINGMSWTGGSEHGDMMSGACSFRRVREWMQTALDKPPPTDPDDNLP
jgi:hypothetical protein